MSVVKYISYPKGKIYPGMSYSDNSSVTEQIDKDVTELKDTKHEWVCKALSTGIAPTGVKLEPCEWHSSYDSSSKHFLNNPPTFGVWVSDKAVIDTCHIQEKLYKDNEDKHVKTMENICRDTSWFIDAKTLHEGFEVDFVKRNALLKDIAIVEKEIKKIKAGPDTKNQDYVILLSRASMAEEMYNQRVISLTKSHKNSVGKIDILEDFISKRTIDEKIALEKAKDDVQRWYNSHLSKDTIVLFEKIAVAQKLADILTSNLKKNFQSSYTYVFRAVQNLHKMRDYYLRYNLKRDYSLEDVKMDILLMEARLGEYHEFANGDSARKIIDFFEKEQACAIREEKAIRSGKAVQRVNNSQTTNVVRIDGTLEKNVAVEQIIIGSMVTITKPAEKSEVSNWRDSGSAGVISNTTPTVATPLTAPSDDSKWSKLR